MGWTDPPDWASGAILTSAQLDTYLTANLVYLKAIADGVTFSGAQVTRGASQSIADTNDEYISWDTENYDHGGWYTSGTGLDVPAGAIPAGFITIQVLAIAHVEFATDAAGKRRIRIHKNGSNVGGYKIPALDDDVTVMQRTELATASAGDTFKVQVWQTSGGALNVTNATLTLARYAPKS